MELLDGIIDRLDIRKSLQDGIDPFFFAEVDILRVSFQGLFSGQERL